MATAQVVETSVTNCLFQDNLNPEDHPSLDVSAPGFKPFHVLGKVLGKDYTEDVQDGNVYKEYFQSDGFFKGTTENQKRSETSKINTDGVALFRSSKYSLWPVYVVINELPPNIRYVFPRKNP